VAVDQLADLSGANLSETKLLRANRCDVEAIEERVGPIDELLKMDLSRANLREAILTEAVLTGANLQGAFLQKAKLQEAKLQEAKLQEAKLQGADLTGSNLQDAKVTDEQLADTLCLQGATMPNGQQYEDWIKDRQKRQQVE